jgi:hypothetical protein
MAAGTNMLPRKTSVFEVKDGSASGDVLDSLWV